jgi:hypothetical protein
VKAKKVELANQNDTEARVLAIATRLHAELGLEWVSVGHKFNTSHEGDRVAAATTADWEYRQATIEWNIPICATLDDEDLLELATHEYVHILNAPVNDNLPDGEVFEKLNEFSVECIARAIGATRRYRP